MYLYLRDDHDIKRVSNVTLQKCSVPSVGTFGKDRIEPALWYKILVLDSIYVDCDSRTVYWNSEKSEASCYLHQLDISQLRVQNVKDFFAQKDQIFKDGQLYDYDPTVDELFGTTKNILQKLSPDVISQHGNESAYEDLLKLLHVFILPEIKFHWKDRASIENVLNEIEKQHENIEKQIHLKDMTKRNTENSLWKLRQNFLRTENFNSAKYVSSLDDKFLCVLLKHIEKDHTNLNDILVNTDQQIKPLRDSISEDEKEALKVARQEQKEVFMLIEKLTVAREEIKNVLYRDHVKKSFRKTRHNTTEFHHLYIEVNRRLEKINTELRDFINCKIKVSSVREATLQTLKELNTDGFSYGYNRKKGTFEIETDLFDPSRKPEEWATLNEKVKTFLTVKQAGYRPKYEKFCTMITQKCQQLLDESKIFGAPSQPLSPTTMDLIDKMGTKSVQRRTHDSVDFPKLPEPPQVTSVEVKPHTYTSRWSMGGISRSACEGICQEVTDHISETASQLATEMNQTETEKNNPSFFNKVYTCYEIHVSEALMPGLCQLYEESYREQCDSLAQWVMLFASSELGVGEETMTRIIQQEKRRSSSDMSADETEAKVPLERSDTQSIASFNQADLKHMHIDDLYDRMNQQHANMAQSFVGALDMDFMDPFQYQTTPKTIETTLSNADNATEQETQFLGSFEDIELPSESASATNVEHEAVGMTNGIVEGTEVPKQAVEALVNQQTSVLPNETTGTMTTTGSTSHNGLFTSTGAGQEFTGATSQNEPFSTTDGTQESAGATSHIQPLNTMVGNATGATMPNEPLSSTIGNATGLSKLKIAAPPAYEEIDSSEVTMRSKCTPKDPPPAYSTLPSVKQTFYKTFDKFFEIVYEEDEACSLFTKLRMITRAVKHVETQITQQTSDGCHGNAAPCADDLLDVLILLLCRLESTWLLKLYAHINLLIHLYPQFMQGNAHDYALVTITVAYQHLFEQQVLHRNRNASLGY